MGICALHRSNMVPPPHYQRRRQRPHNPLQTATTVAAAAVAAYGTYRLASWAWDSLWNATGDDERAERDDARDEACVENSTGNNHHASQHSTPLRNGASSPTSESAQKRRRHALVRRHRIARCRLETTAALSDFLPTLQQTVERSTDFSSETAELKQIRRARGDRLRRRMGGEVTTSNRARGEGAAEGGDDASPAKQQQVSEQEEHAERRRETELWETIKVRSLSRLLVTAYGHSLLLLVLTVQVHLLGGRLFREEEEAEAAAEQNTASAEVEITTSTAANADGFSTTSSLGLQSRTDGPNSRPSRSSSMPSYQSTHRTVLTQTYGHFFASGMAELLQVVQEAVAQVFAEYDVTDPDTMHMADEEFNRAVDAVRSLVEESGSVGGALRSALVRYIVQQPEEGAGVDLPPDVGDDAVAAHILEETWDILESPTFAAAERDVLDLTYGMIREGGWGGIFPPTTAMMMDVPQSPQASSVHGGASTRPLAQVVTQLRRTTNTFYAGVDRGSEANEGQPPNVYLPAVDRLPALLELGDVGFN